MTSGRSIDELVRAIPDPEIPVISIGELGIVRSVETRDDSSVVVRITPTYSGCPALDAIRGDITAALRTSGHEQVDVRTVLRPAWSPDWISERGRDKLRAFGIAPPRPAAKRALFQIAVRCPRYDSPRTRLVSRFGSTPCKAHRVCVDCAEPFDHFKEL